MGKATGRSGSEPRRSLVTYLEMPTLWSEGEGRCLREQNEHPPSGSSGVAGAACGGRDTVQDGRPTAGLTQSQQPLRIRRSEIAGGCRRESEGFIVPLEGEGQHNPARGKGPYFVHVSDEWRIRGLPWRYQPRRRSGHYRGNCLGRPSLNPASWKQAHAS